MNEALNDPSLAGGNLGRGNLTTTGGITTGSGSNGSTGNGSTGDAPDSAQQKALRAGLPSAQAMATGLGWFSIALGLAELLAPRVTAQLTGTQQGKNLLQAYGLREITTGIGLLTAKDPQPWLWARVAGDALDVATLVTDLRSGNPQRRNAAWSLMAVMGVTALDVWAANAAHRAAQAPVAPVRDYSDRVGMALSPDEMRGKARDALQAQPDMQTPPPLAPYPMH